MPNGALFEQHNEYVVDCAHCTGKGKCSCGTCRVQLPPGARYEYVEGICQACGGSGKIVIRYEGKP